MGWWVLHVFLKYNGQILSFISLEIKKKKAKVVQQAIMCELDVVVPYK